MLEQVAPHVARVALRSPTLPPATTTNTLIVGRGRLVVIEPAPVDLDARASLLDLLQPRLQDGERVAAIVLTHHHADHIGFARELQRHTGAPVIAHRETSTRLGVGFVDELVEDGDVLDFDGDARLEVIHTPGHAPGHVALRELDSGVIYVGDMLAGEGTILIDPADDGDMQAYLASLRRLRALDAVAFVPSHGPVLRQTHAIIDHYVAHRLAREQSVLDAVRAGERTLEAIAARAYREAPMAPVFLTRASTLAHLHKLVREQCVIADERGWSTPC